MGLTQKILLFTSLIVVALAGTTLVYSTAQADRLAHQTIGAALAETQSIWETFQADRYQKLKLGLRVLANDPGFKALVANVEDPATRQVTVYDTLKERVADLGADFFVATDPDGFIIARSDRAGAEGDDLSRDPLVMRPMELGQESSTIWRQGGALYHAVSVPMTIGPDFIGVLIACYGIDDQLATQIRKLTHSEIVYLSHTPGRDPEPFASTLGAKGAALRDKLAAPEFATGGAGTGRLFQIELAGDRHVGVQLPLKAATDDVLGSVLAMRSLTLELADFKQFQNSLLVATLAVMVLALAAAYLVASRITGPVRRLVGIVEKARDGSFTGAVEVAGGDEISALGRSFNRLLVELREKEQMIGFLREGMTLLKKGAGETGASPAATLDGGAETAAVAVPGRTAALGRGMQLAGRYEILDVLGRGGMGVVYRAQDRKLDEVVAVKVLRSEALSADPTLLERFKQEIRLARRITHRNVLRTHDFGEADGIPYISMEYLEGVTLKELIRSKGALPVGVGLRIAKQMCQGLDAAHQQGVVHRDIKPQNMLILPETGELKIMDFGIARVSEMKGEASGLTSTGTVMGTPDYIAPEQAQGQPADFRSDIYSLAVVLYELFTGSLPFKGDSVMAVVLSHIQTPPPLPRQVNPRLPAEVEAVILRGMDKAPARRYPRVGDMLQELTEVSAGLDAAGA